MSDLDRAVEAIREKKPRRVVAFTGAGVSADSGIPTFRGPGGLWRDFRPEDLATLEAFERDPDLVWEWYEWRRGLIRDAQPNAAHHAIAELPDAVVVTQNVDGLHARAGSRNVIELHGNIFRVRCMRERRISMREEALTQLPPRCECGSLLRPDVVWFGEMLPEEALARASAAIMGADLLLVIGTSGIVYPAAGLVTLHQGLSIEVNPQVAQSPCTMSVAGRAAEVVPRLVEAVRDSGFEIRDSGES
ncbi:MAG TPA: NAD-dependent deacylase [Thermoanaerobaculia bacterium]|nr:NAD-dependent deacylase [Thermoanaerobaculia bacterium]